jgi:hypothetical protein
MFYAAIAAGAAFIAIGIASSIYATQAVDVRLDNTIKPGLSDDITPDMNVGNTASIMVSGSTFDIKIEDPDKQVVTSKSNATSFNYDLTAQKDGEYHIGVKNMGSTTLSIAGHTQTKSSPLGLSGALMLLVTGVIVVGLGLRFSRR